MMRLPQMKKLRSQKTEGYTIVLASFCALSASGAGLVSVRPYVAQDPDCHLCQEVVHKSTLCDSFESTVEGQENGSDYWLCLLWTWPSSQSSSSSSST
mmetsp:Transcript_165167/g.292520  ORF Transcript_165167/g.292520 Transcript_165167/m.292520 type:complete len:98 (+) Transcript_165167:1182-1475(+)